MTETKPITKTELTEEQRDHELHWERIKKQNMTKEKPLSSKRTEKCYYCCDDLDEGFYPEEDVKEAVKRLKEELIQRGKDSDNPSFRRGLAWSCAVIDKRMGNFK